MYKDVIEFIRETFGEKERDIPLHAPCFVGNEKKYLEVKLSPSYPIPKQISSNLPNKSYVHKPHLQECKQNCLSIYHRPPTNHNVLLS